MDLKEEKNWRNKNLDGIICHENFRKAKIRILFIGYEPWVETKNDLDNYQGQIDSVLRYGGNPTGDTYLANACRIAAGLLNTERKGCLFNTALINIKKSPRIGSEANDKEIEDACEYNQEYIFNQIKEINPSIIIGSNILDGEKKLWNPWFKYRNDRLLHVSFDNKEFNDTVNNSNIDFYIEQASKMIFIDIPHLASGGRGKFGFKKDLIDIIVEGYKFIESREFCECEEWIPRRKRR